MNAPDFAFTLFATCNFLRVLAYFPQMALVVRRRGGAASISFATWLLFAMANVSTAIYAGQVLADVTLTAVHAFNAACCAAVLGLAAWRRRCPVP